MAEPVLEIMDSSGKRYECVFNKSNNYKIKIMLRYFNGGDFLIYNSVLDIKLKN
jgi:hypothetical protein